MSFPINVHCSYSLILMTLFYMIGIGKKLLIKEKYSFY